ncbi:MAG: RHS repeat-associated core domain-containing protein, partial [Bacteroidota bacterium]
MGYGFAYDGLNRLKDAQYGSMVSNTWSPNDRYSADYSYDLNGNILSINRKGLTATNTYGDIDMLSYSYQGNQLTAVSDAIPTNFSSTEHFQDGFTGTDYSYDASGNMTGDLNRSILVGYNHLNKPTFVEKGVNAGITYIYSADGTKLRQKVHDFSSAPMGRPSNSQSQVLDPSTVTKITDYVGPYQYEDADGNATQVDKQLIQFQHAKGRATWDGSEFHYQYNLTDHLGNIRVVFQDGDKDGRVNPDPIAGQDVVQVIQGYYPFGMSHSGSFATTTSPENQYLYNGKEKQDELNLGWYDYGARMYDVTIGRWNGVDALAENPMQIEKSPYAYTWNNPTNLTDPDGNCPICPAIPLAIPVIVEVLQYAIVATTAYFVYDQKEEIAEGTERIIDDLGEVLKPTPDEEPDGDPKPVVPPDDKVAEDEEAEYVYRGGSASDKNFTPRPGKDDGYGPKSGLSTFDSHEGATFGRGGKSQKLNARVLRDAGFALTKTPDG